jgi:hypothetical protein
MSSPHRTPYRQEDVGVGAGHRVDESANLTAVVVEKLGGRRHGALESLLVGLLEKKKLNMLIATTPP